VPDAVAKLVAETGLRSARQRDGGDGVARDETAWTWWTLLPAISGCLAQKYPWRIGDHAGPARTGTHAGMRFGGATTYCCSPIPQPDFMHSYRWAGAWSVDEVVEGQVCAIGCLQGQPEHSRTARGGGLQSGELLGFA